MLDPLAFRSQAVRDLAWLIASPPLLATGAGLPLPPADWCAAAADDAETWLHGLDHDPAPLERLALVEQPLRLGHYAERLLAAWIAARPRFRPLASRLAVSADGRVLGELDLAFVDAERGPLHWEIAAKFFLRCDRDGYPTWLGVDGRDSLAAKIAHLRSHQVPLGGHPIALAALGLDRPPRSEAFVKGWLFQRTDDRRPGSDPAIAPDHGRGWWLRADEEPPAPERRADRWLLPPHAEWMSPCRRPPRADDLLADRELRRALADDSAHRPRRPRLVAAMRRDAEGWWSERARGLVVPMDWPGGEPEREDGV